jgi:hypothetical protein
MGEDELGTPCALRRGERKTRQTREFADALFEQGQKLADADGVDAVQFMERDMAVVEGEVVEPGRCRRQLLGLRRQVFHVVVFGAC